MSGLAQAGGWTLRVAFMRQMARPTASAGAHQCPGKKFAAASPPALWRKIFLENKEELLTGLEDFSTMIDDLKKLIRSEDAVALEAFLARARATRERLP